MLECSVGVPFRLYTMTAVLCVTRMPPRPQLSDILWHLGSAMVSAAGPPCCLACKELHQLRAASVTALCTNLQIV